MGEMVEFAANGSTARGYVAAAAGGSGPGVIVLQEWWGLVPQIKGVCDLLAGEGFTALAPDLYQGEMATHTEMDKAGELMTSLPPERAARDMSAAIDYLLGHDACSSSTVGVTGFCMGGLLAMGLTALQPDLVSDLILMATPWDFHVDNPTQFEVAAAFSPMLPAVLHIWGELPVDVLQALFASLDVFQIGRKFHRFAGMNPRSAAARDFVAMEDWLNDGIPLTRRVAVEVMHGWYVQNLPGRGRWRIAKQGVRPEKMGQSALIVVPQNDKIVPPGTALALGNRLENATVMVPKAGHIGMVAGGNARTRVWEPIADWLTLRVKS